MTVLLTLFGVALIFIVLRDIFHTLFHPSGSGALSSQGSRFVWRVFRSIAHHCPSVLSLAGPVSLLLVITLWTLGLTLGWALLLWPYLPEDFLLSTGLVPGQNDGLLDAVYLSLVTLATLGYGDITPQTTWLRLIVPLEALVGFALMTVAISWILSIYPVLSRRRNLARQVALLQQAGQWEETIVAGSGATALSDIFSRLAEQVISVRNDYSQFPITYYFHGPDRESALDIALPHMVYLAHQASQHPSASVRLHAQLLRDAVGDLATYIAGAFLECSNAKMDQVLIAFAEDHLRQAGPAVREAADTGEESL